MSSIRIVDTSVLCNLLRVPGRDQDAAQAAQEFLDAVDGGDVLLLPIAVIYETGNHVAHVVGGSARRAAAERFVGLVRQAFTGTLPFVPTPLQNSDDLLPWLDEFPDSAMRGMGFGDLAITKVFAQQCALNQGRRVLIWSYDRHLQGYDQPPRL